MLHTIVKPMCTVIVMFVFFTMQAQPVLETGGQNMPSEWIDKDTKHKIKKIIPLEGNNSSFYFHNNPFIDNNMVFYNTPASSKIVINKMGKVENSDIKGKQLYIINLETSKTEQLTSHYNPVNGEIVHSGTKQVYYQVLDSVFSININTRQQKLVYVFPENIPGRITTVNADGSLLAGAYQVPGSEKKNPAFDSLSAFNKIYEEKALRRLFVIDIKKGTRTDIFSDTAWLNHHQFSPVNPNLLLFVHEGPWHKVNRIWTIDIVSKKVTPFHPRTMDMEIAGHEWFSRDGKTIWFDLQQPRGKQFFVAGADVTTTREIKYELQRNEWSVHYTSSPDNTLFAGDGGSAGSVAKSPDGQWIYLFTPGGNSFKSKKLVNMKHHNYQLEPNVHFSPDMKWIIFRANFEGHTNVYAVEIADSK